MKTPENKVKDKVRDKLKARGYYYFSPVQMGKGSRTLDLLVALPLRIQSPYGELQTALFVAIEVKRKDGKLTPLQKTIMEEIQNKGGHTIWGDDPDHIVSQLDSIREYFRGLVLRVRPERPFI